MALKEGVEAATLAKVGVRRSLRSPDRARRRAAKGLEAKVRVKGPEDSLQGLQRRR
jgi:hypothetical protein